jgi:hypothetical protein
MAEEKNTTKKSDEILENILKNLMKETNSEVKDILSDLEKVKGDQKNA